MWVPLTSCSVVWRVSFSSVKVQACSHSTNRTQTAGRYICKTEERKQDRNVHKDKYFQVCSSKSYFFYTQISDNLKQSVFFVCLCLSLAVAVTIRIRFRINLSQQGVVKSLAASRRGQNLAASCRGQSLAASRRVPSLAASHRVPWKVSQHHAAFKVSQHHATI